jgi:hypothetical protein
MRLAHGGDWTARALSTVEGLAKKARSGEEQPVSLLDPIRGSEQAGTRPVLVLQVDPLTELLRTIVIVPFTSNR